ncbi:MAG: cytochrome c3 family protein [Myxococcales bacterium]|nr:FHA domain-containing protein [Myxococcales bacterium]HIK86371.1 FHA domain-containing protein [Myxococcales bacterium]
MRVSLSQIKLRPGGKRVRLDQSVEGESLYIGRGPDNDLCLQGLTTSLHHATMRIGDGNVYIEAAQGQEVVVNGLPTTGERLAIGDEIHIGAWTLRLLEANTGEDFRLEYEERQLSGNARDALDMRTRLGIERGIFARRPLSWIGLGLILLGFFVLPMFVPAMRPFWTSGPVIRGHAMIEDDCASCHDGLFRQVSNNSCTSCHVDIRRHTRQDLAMPGLDEMACSDCHLEHRGREVALTDQGATYCVTCHGDLSSQVADTKLANASDFGSNHPPIQLAVVENPNQPPHRLVWSEGLEEDSGVEFDHHFHTSQVLERPDGSEEWLSCGQCHQVREDGRSMQLVQFDRNCRRCHPLDTNIPEIDIDSDLMLIHGDPEKLRDQLRTFFTSQVLEARIQDRHAPASLRRRLPGPLIGTEERAVSADWIGSKVASADKFVFTDDEHCMKCHQVIGGKVSEQTGNWIARGVMPIQLQQNWIQSARFSHSAHATQACSTCHPGASVRADDIEPGDEPKWAQFGAIPYGRIDERSDFTVSESSSEIMIPRIEVCQDCHVSAGQNRNRKVPSTCSSCHDFHDHTLPPMAQEQAASPHGTTEPTAHAGG